MAYGTQHLAAIGLNYCGSILLEGMAKGIVGGDEEPAVSAGLDNRFSGSVGERPCVVSPVNSIGRTFVTGKRRARGAGNQKHLILFLDDFIDSESHPRIGDIRDHV